MVGTKRELLFHNQPKIWEAEKQKMFAPFSFINDT